MPMNYTSDLPVDELITMFETDVWIESLPNDIFDHLSGNVIYDGGKESPVLPDAIYMKLDAKADDARRVRVPMIKAFSGSPNLGSDADPRGTEEDIITKHADFEYTDMSHVSANQSYGIIARDKMPYKIFEKRVPLEANYWKEYFGKMRRQACIEGQSENLLEAPIFNSPMINPNIFVPNLNDSSQPLYNMNYDHYVNHIADALIASGTSEAACVSVRFCQRLQDWLFSTKFITPLDMPDGMQGYIYVLPMPQVTWLKHPVNARTLGPIWRDITALPKEGAFTYPGAIGMLDRLLIVSDARYATMTLGGSGSAGKTSVGSAAGGNSITFRYRGMGNSDTGSSDPRDFSTTARQVGIVLGKHGLVEWMPEKFHWEWEYEMYDKHMGAGLFLSGGIKLVQYDKTNGKTYRTKQAPGVAITPLAVPPREGY